MLRVSQNQSRTMLALLTVAAVALSACGGGSATTGTSGNAGQTSGTIGTTNQPGTSSQPTPVSTGLAAAASALEGVTSYRFTMTETGGTFGPTLSLLPDASNGTPTFNLSGTFVLKPDKAADVTIAGALRVISIGGFDYQDNALQGSYTKNDTASPGLVASLSPDYVFTTTFGPTFDFTNGFDKKLSESKNGVDTDYYESNDTGASALKELGSVAGVPDAAWTAAIWVAQQGGYPVKMTITATSVATPTSAAAVVFVRTFDITKVNDTGNKVPAQTNVTGA